MEEKNQKPMSIEQAHNKLQQDKATLFEDCQKAANGAPITIMPDGDRLKFLQYSISLLDETSPEAMNLMPDTIRNQYTCKEMAGLLKVVLAYRARGYTCKAIARFIGFPEDKVEFLESIAVMEVRKVIAAKKLDGMPLIGDPS